MNECEFYFSVRFYSYYSFVNEQPIPSETTNQNFRHFFDKFEQALQSIIMFSEEIHQNGSQCCYGRNHCVVACMSK